MDNRILVLDDEESITQLLANYLTSRSYACDATNSPHEALELLKKNRYALLLTDLKMPKMDGLEVVRLAKEIDPDLAIIVVTALLEITNAIQAMRTGADDYVLKPFNLSEISLSIAHAIEKRSQTIEARRYQQELSARIDAAAEDLERVNSELLETKQYLENLLDSTVDAILTMSTDGRVNFANTGALRMFGFAQDQLVGLPAEELFAGGMEEVGFIQRILAENRYMQNYETVVLRSDGQRVPVSVTFSQVRGKNEVVISTLAMCKDITEQKRLEKELKEMSIKDSLSGLYNQGYFYDRLKSEIERARRQGHPLSLLLFDVDHFKTYNDCHGHLEGDRVLRTVADVVRECTRDHVDIGFRYGGDEFTVILPEADETQARLIGERIRSGFEAHRFDHLTLSVGIMAYRDGYSLRSFIQFADTVMYDAKRAGGNRVYVYKPEGIEKREDAPA